MKNWIFALLVVFLGAGLVGCSTTSSSKPSSSKEDYKSNNPQLVNGGQQASNRQHLTSPLASQVTTAEKASPGKKQVADKKEKSEKDASVNDKILSLWRHLPSTQWFVNDVKQEDVG